MKAKNREGEGRIDAKTSACQNAPPKEGLHALNENLAAVPVPRQANDALAQSEQRFQALTEKSSDLIAIVDPKGVITYVSPNTQSVLGYAADELQGHGLFEKIHADERAAAQILFAQCSARPGAVRRAEVRFAARNGDWHWLETVGTNLVDDPAVGGIVLNSRDVTGRRAVEESLRRANRALRALRNNSQAMVRAENESAYLREVCRIVKEDCGYAMVWVGFAEDDADKSVRPAAWAGFEEGYLDTLKLTWADAERGRGPTGTAIRTARVCRCLNMLEDPQFLPWREQAVKRGYASSIALPLLDGGKAFGALTIYAREPVGFADVEVELLTELSRDFSQGIILLRLRAAKARAEEALRQKESELSEAQHIACVGSWQWDAQTDVTLGTDELLRIYGFDPATQSMPDFRDQKGRCYPAGDWERVNAAVQETVRTGAGYELDVQAFRSGVPIWVTTRGEAVRDAAGRITGLRGTVQDITERKRADLLSQTLNSIHATIHATPHVEQILQGVITEAAQALGCDTASVSLRRDNQWVVSYAHGFPENVVGMRMNDEEEPHALLAIQMQQPLAIDDAFTDRRVNCAHMKKWGVRSVLVVPLQIRHEARGVLFFNYRRAPCAFGPAHLDFAAKLAAAVSLALENARLFTDIKAELSERKQAEEALRGSEERYRTLFSTLIEGFCVIEVLFDADDRPIDYRFLEINPAFEAQTGLHAAQGKRMRELAPEQEAYWFEMYGKVARTGEPARFVSESKALNRWFDVSAYRVGGPDSRKVAILFNDITERMWAENALRIAHARLALAQTAAGAGAWDWDFATGKLEWSTELFHLFGLDPAQVEANFDSWHQIMHPDDRQAAEEKVNAAIRDHERLQNEYRVVLPSGETRWISAVGDTVYDENGHALSMSGLCIDLTARKQAEDLLRDAAVQKQASQYSRSLIEASPDPLVTISSEGKITDVNEATIQATGVSREELVGTDFSRYFTEPEQAKQGYERVFSAGFVTSYPLTIRHRDGHQTDVLYNASLYRDASGKIQGVFAAARDVTAQKRAEVELQQANEALEQRVAERTAELKATNDDLTRFNRAMVDRELRMIELKQQVNDLCLRAGQPLPYAPEPGEDSPA